MPTAAAVAPPPLPATSTSGLTVCPASTATLPSAWIVLAVCAPIQAWVVMVSTVTRIEPWTAISWPPAAPTAVATTLGVDQARTWTSPRSADTLESSMCARAALLSLVLTTAAPIASSAHSTPPATLTMVESSDAFTWTPPLWAVTVEWPAM